MKVYRSAFADPYLPKGQYESDQSLLQRCQLVAPINHLRLARLMLFMRVCVRGNAALFAALVAAHGHCRSWLKAVRIDLQWLQGRHEAFQSNASNSLA
eukprot:11423143-Karenia_brevis.AAC.1